jgi:glycerol-3-phosphate cytidylyltransferase
MRKIGRVCHELKSSGKKIVLTSGCFDLLHRGHLEHLIEVGSFGYLVVGINSDRFVKKMKGPYRPLHNENDRAFLMAGFSPVRLVVVFDDDYALIETVRPDIYVLSVISHIRISDDPKRVNLLRKLGSEIREVCGKKIDSTTNIIQRAALVVVNSR